LNLTASEEMNSFLPMEVFERGPFPYKDLDLALGYDPQSQSLVINSNAFPTAMMVYGIRVCSKSSDVFEEANKMDLKRVALVEGGAGLATTESAQEGDPVRVGRYGENDLLCEVDAKAPGVLVLNEAWYPGWKCIIEGKVTESFPVNGWMRGFRMPAGKRSAHIYFRQNYLGPGAGISAFGLLMGMAAIYCRRRIKQ
jgi:hypothetical protein